MRYAIEFFRRTTAYPDGKTVSREVADFENIEEARARGLVGCPDEADGFRLFVAGMPKGTVSIRSETHDA